MGAFVKGDVVVTPFPFSDVMVRHQHARMGAVGRFMSRKV
jgi:hypothetical protein